MVKKEWIDKGFVDEPVAKELDLKSEIRELCRKKNAVIMAHYYTEGIIQDLADRSGYHRHVRCAFHGRDQQDSLS